MRKRNGSILVMAIILVFCVGCSKNRESEYLKVALQHLEDLKYVDALESLELVREEGVTNERILERAEGIAYLGLTEYDEAIQSFLNALSYSGGMVQEIDYDLNYYLATAYFKNGNYDEALQIYDAILGLKPNDSKVHYWKGVVKLKQGAVDEACTSFDQAIEADKKNYDLIISIHQNLSVAGHEERGNAYLQAILDGSFERLTNEQKGKIYYYMKDYNEAVLCLAQVKNAGEEAVLMLGKTYEELGDLNYAITVYQGFLAQQDSSTIYNQLALSLMKMQKYEEALDSIQSALELEEITNKQALEYNEIVVYEYLNDFDKALIRLEDYLVKYPDDASALREYEFLKTR